MMHTRVFPLFLLLITLLAACSSAPRTVDPPARPGAVTPPVEEVEPEEEGEPDPEDAPVQETPAPPDSTVNGSGIGGASV